VPGAYVDLFNALPDELHGAGHPGVLKETYRGEPHVVETMRVAYAALGRTAHVARAEAWLRDWGSDPE